MAGEYSPSVFSETFLSRSAAAVDSFNPTSRVLRKVILGARSTTRADPALLNRREVRHPCVLNQVGFGRSTNSRDCPHDSESSGISTRFQPLNPRTDPRSRQTRREGSRDRGDRRTRSQPAQRNRSARISAHPAVGRTRPHRPQPAGPTSL